MPPVDRRPVWFDPSRAHSGTPQAGTAASRSGSVNAAGQSSTAVLLVFGPDADEVAAVNDRLSAALLDHLRWQQIEGPPPG